MTALMQQLRASRRDLKKSEKMNKQLQRQAKKLDERLDSMMKIQKLNAERQLNELKDDQGGASHSRVVSPAQPEQSKLIAVTLYVNSDV